MMKHKILLLSLLLFASSGCRSEFAMSGGGSESLFLLNGNDLKNVRVVYVTRSDELLSTKGYGFRFLAARNEDAPAFADLQERSDDSEIRRVSVGLDPVGVLRNASRLCPDVEATDRLWVVGLFPLRLALSSEELANDEAVIQSRAVYFGGGPGVSFVGSEHMSARLSSVVVFPRGLVLTTPPLLIRPGENDQNEEVDVVRIIDLGPEVRLRDIMHGGLSVAQNIEYVTDDVQIESYVVEKRGVVLWTDLDVPEATQAVLPWTLPEFSFE